MKHLKNIPARIELEKNTIKDLITAHRELAEFKTLAKTIPNENILIKTLPLLESKESSEIEQIVTTYDDVFKSSDDKTLKPQEKEVKSYEDALIFGYHEVKKKGFISVNLLIKLFQIIKNTDEGIRKIPGVELKNEKGDVIYTPPQGHSEIMKYLSELETFINSDNDDYDPLIKMAMIHYYFETIHPFSDGNGRVGRILNILYLVKEELLDLPILYLSGAIINSKGLYYNLLKEVTAFSGAQNESAAWNMYLKGMLLFIRRSSFAGVCTITDMNNLMSLYKKKIREESSIYSHELLNTMFAYPYVKTEYIINNVGVTRPTATKYLQKLEDLGLLSSIKIGNIRYYVNTGLMQIFKNIEY